MDKTLIFLHGNVNIFVNISISLMRILATYECVYEHVHNCVYAFLYTSFLHYVIIHF
jgi:hypothetical protein